jgi:hypothetical protein
LLLLGALLTPACDSITAPETLVLYVGPVQVDCVGLGPRKCLQTRRSPDAPWEAFYDTIEGFTWEPGFTWRLRVRRFPVKDPPQDASAFRYALIQVLEKQATPPS